MFKLLKFLFLGLFLSSFAFAKQELEPKLKQAETFYDQEKYQEATALYEESIKDYKVSSAVYYNLGNSYYRLGAKGKAMAAYLAARELSPRDPDVQHNLHYVQGQVEDKVNIDDEGTLKSVLTLWTHLITTEELQILCLLFFCFGMILWLVRLFVDFSHLFVQAQFSFLLVAFVLAIFWKSSDFLQKDWGAVSVAEAKIHSGPGENNTTLFTLHDGAPIVVEESRQDWYKISFSKDRRGWVKASDVTFFQLSS